MGKPPIPFWDKYGLRGLWCVGCGTVWTYSCRLLSNETKLALSQAKAKSVLSRYKSVTVSTMIVRSQLSLNKKRRSK